MSDEADRTPDDSPRKRGEAAWKEAKQQIAERNERARRAGRAQREAHERDKAQARYAAERRQMADLAKLKTP